MRDGVGKLPNILIHLDHLLYFRLWSTLQLTVGKCELYSLSIRPIQISYLLLNKALFFILYYLYALPLPHT